MLAARFQQLGLLTLVIEKDARIGDEWRRRYRTLALHTPKEQHTRMVIFPPSVLSRCLTNASVLYSSYPDTWPPYTPKEKLADWFEAYAKMHDLLVWTSAPLLSDPQPVYSDADVRWTVRIGQPDGSVRTLRCAHIVLATGALGPPNIPAVPGEAAFRGRVLHASAFSSGAAFAGQRVLVVGAANTAADVCEDLAAGGAARVTMLQRSATCTVLPHALAAHFAQTFPPGADVALCDFRIAGVPFRVRERLVLAEREARIARGEDPDVEPEDLERMRKVQEKGFLVHHGREGRGLLFVILERFGGQSSSASSELGTDADYRTPC
jgi:cation diffusion facilitator CzcD-associated flavoprotein CzcO